MGKEVEEDEVGVVISMDKFMEALDALMAVCTILHDAVHELSDSIEDHPALHLVKKPDPDGAA